MKTKKLFLTLMCAVSALTFTACGDDNESSGLTPQQIAQAYTQVKGTYEGKLIYSEAKPTSAAKDVTDTLAVHWTIDTDSTLTLRDFPVQPIVEHLKDAELAKALESQPVKPLTCYVGYYRLSPVAFLINPTTASYDVTYDGKSHNIKIAFYINSNYSFGAYQPTDKLMQMQLLVGGIYIDGQLDKTKLTEALPLVFKGNKR